MHDEKSHDGIAIERLKDLIASFHVIWAFDHYSRMQEKLSFRVEENKKNRVLQFSNAVYIELVHLIIIIQSEIHSSSIRFYILNIF